VLPKLFLDSGYSVTVMDPPYANCSRTSDLRIFNDYPEIRAENVITDKYSDAWLLKDGGFSVSYSRVLKSELIRFLFFKIMPFVFRNFIYDHGHWLKTSNIKTTSLPQPTMQNYAALALLPGLTAISADDSTHRQCFQTI
jgi:hypothetical protein